MCLVFVMLLRLFIAALWSPAGKGPTSWLLFVMSNCDSFTFPCGILDQVWYLIVLIPDLCRLFYFVLTSSNCIHFTKSFLRKNIDDLPIGYCNNEKKSIQKLCVSGIVLFLELHVNIDKIL